MDNSVLVSLFQLAALVTAITVLSVGIVKITKFFKKAVHFFDDFLGENARPGVPQRPGMSERISNMESCINKVNQRLNTIEHKVQSIDKELQPNSGASLRDAVVRIEKRLEHVESEVW